MRIPYSVAVRHCLTEWLGVALSGACSQKVDSKHDAPLSALAEKVREKQETTKVGTDIVQGL